MVGIPTKYHVAKIGNFAVINNTTHEKTVFPFLIPFIACRYKYTLI